MAFALALVVFAGAAGFAFEFAVFAVVVFVVVVVVVVVVFAGATLVVVVVLALLAGLLALLLAASPQAMPRALRPRTVESTSTFFILILRLLSILKDRLTLVRPSADLTQPFLPETLSFSGKR